MNDKKEIQRKKSVKHLKSTLKNLSQKTDSTQLPSDLNLKRFEKSMNIDYEKWHDGLGYDLDAIKSASATERKTIEQILIQHNPRDWRDIEAMSQIATANARKTIKRAMNDPNPNVRIAVTRYAPKLVSKRDRSKSLINALQNAELFGGLSQTLDDIEKYHPKEIKEALIKGLLSRKGEVATLFAAMLFYIYGKADEPFDMNQRPFFLRFNTENKTERLAVFLELCKTLNIKPEKYLA